jgi:hypothetical protein
MQDPNNSQLSVIVADDARQAADELVVLRKYSAALARKLETRGAELTQVLAQLHLEKPQGRRGGRGLVA